MFRKRKEREILEKIKEEIVLMEYENGTMVMNRVLKAIEQDKNLLEYYFNKIDWSKVDKDSIHSKLFETNNKQNKRR